MPLVRDALTGYIRPPEMSRATLLGSARKQAHSLFFVAIIIWVSVAGCGQGNSLNAPAHTPVGTPSGTPRKIRIVPVEGQPLEQVLPQFHPDTRQFIEDFKATVPESLPPLAFAAFSAVNPQFSSFLPESQLSIVEITDDGYAEFLIAQANIGSNPFQPNVLCLHNGRQVSCSPEADVWQLTLAPETVALMTARIPAERGDHITLLFLPDREPERAQLGANIKWVDVEERVTVPTTWVKAPTHTSLYGGCDFVTLIKDPAATDFMNFNLHAGVQRSVTLYLLIQLCNPTGNEYIQLTPVADRTTVVDMPGDEWHSTLRLHSRAHLIPVDTSYFDQAKEFQIALIPISDEAKLAFRNKSFTQAVLFKEP